jgi:hypothetical protein
MRPPKEVLRSCPQNAFILKFRTIRHFEGALELKSYFPHRCWLF